MGFFATIGRGWQMSKLSMSVVKKDPELMVYMIISGVLSMAAFVAIAIPQIMEMSWAIDAEGAATPAYLGFTFVGYMLVSIIVVFWNCAIVANANIRLSGGDPSFSDGFRAALSRLPIIILWGIIAGTVGLLLKMLEGAARSSDNDAMKVLATIVHLIGGLAWFVMTFFMLPYMIIEGKSVGESLSSSKNMFFKTWGEQITSGLGIALIAFLIGIPIVIITLALTVAIGPIGLIFGAICIALLVATVNAAEQVAVVALYHFGTTGQMPQLYQDAGMMTYTFGNAATV